MTQLLCFNKIFTISQVQFAIKAIITNHNCLNNYEKGMITPRAYNILQKNLLSRLMTILTQISLTH